MTAAPGAAITHHDAACALWKESEMRAISTLICLGGMTLGAGATTVRVDGPAVWLHLQ